MPPAPQGALPEGGVPPGSPSQAWDDWPPSTSPLLEEFSGKEEREWTLAGRRVVITGTACGGVGTIRLHPYRMVGNTVLEVDGTAPEPVSVRVAPDEIVRVLQSGEVQLTERITTALDQGLVFWSLVADAPVAIRLSWTTDFDHPSSVALPESALRLIAPDEAGTGVRVGLADAPPVFQVQTHGSVTEPPPMVTLVEGPAFRFEVRGDRLLRLTLAGGADEPELERALDALRRRKLRAFRQDRILHVRRLEERLVVVESPDPALDRAFGWAKVRLDASLAETPGLGRSPTGAFPVRTALAMLAVGDRDLAKDSIRSLARAHAAAPDSDSLPLLQLVECYVRWSGDLAPLTRLWPVLEGAARESPAGLPSGLARGLAAIARAADREDVARELERHAAEGAAGPQAASAEATGWRARDLLTADPASLVLGVVEGLWGIRADALAAEVRVEPLLPDPWPETGLRRLRVGATTLDLRLRRRMERTVVMARRVAGPAIGLRLRLRTRSGAGPVTVDQVEVGREEVVFTLQDEHEVVYHD